MIKHLFEFLFDGLVVMVMFFLLFVTFYHVLDWALSLVEVLYG